MSELQSKKIQPFFNVVESSDLNRAELASDAEPIDLFKVKPGTKVITIERPVNALSIEKVLLNISAQHSAIFVERGSKTWNKFFCPDN